MNKPVPLLFIFCAFLSLFSCNFQSSDPAKILAEAEKIIEDYPDSVRHMLMMFSPYQGYAEDIFHKYELLNVQSKNKSGKAIANDTLIFRTAQYYADIKDNSRAALAFFYAGRVLQEQGDEEKAIVYYKDAERYASEGNDYNLKGLIQFDIGEFYYYRMSESSWGKSIEYYKRAADYFHRAGKYANEIISYNWVGMSFHQNRHMDSSYYYYGKALSLAALHEDYTEHGRIKQNMGVIFSEEGNNDLARSHYREALSYFTDTMDIAPAYLNVAATFDSKTERDSVDSYIEKAKSLIDDNNSSFIMRNVSHLLSSIESDNENYKQALEHHQQYARYMNEEWKRASDQAVFDIENKYNFEVVENKNSQLRVQRLTIILISVAVMAILIASIYYLVRRNKAEKTKRVEAEKNYALMQEMAESYNNKETSMRDVLLKHFNILKKSAMLESFLKEDEKQKGEKLLKRFNEIVYGQDAFNWDNLFEIMNHIQDNFPNKLRDKFPQLDDAEMKICCLTVYDFNNTEISIIMNQKLNTIQMKKSVIRKKLGIEGYGNIKDYIKEAIS